MDKAQILEQAKKRQQLIDEAVPQMLERSKTGQRDVTAIKKIDAIMKSSKSAVQKQKELQSLLKSLQS